MSTNTKKGLPFPLIIVAIILGFAIYKQFDFETFTFRKPLLATVYIITFAVSVYVIVKSAIRNNSNSK